MAVGFTSFESDNPCSIPLRQAFCSFAVSVPFHFSANTCGTACVATSQSHGLVCNVAAMPAARRATASSDAHMRSKPVLAGLVLHRLR
eukprot:4593858-Prymnesium_polylepis.1